VDAAAEIGGEGEGVHLDFTPMPSWQRVGAGSFLGRLGHPRHSFISSAGDDELEGREQRVLDARKLISDSEKLLSDARMNASASRMSSSESRVIFSASERSFPASEVLTPDAEMLFSESERSFLKSEVLFSASGKRP
jgi:hypothetical protein